ncbi:LLM class flavin-dependent oxidoreductase [Halolamina sp.]|jgi:alkanesulfonate monooxygenase SsuD/methylene tetrahydromethanopterin reductase-like flavin-dependent oxidoreductase (luciferase family)|uniref:LLM class flavin-dependent oxidoreductase n=1 Tax=Halolamina sp. TaxID=1940283 RepID=UPI00356842E4
MEFGYGLLTAQRPPGSGRGYEQVYDESIRLAQLAEKHGFDVAWTSEHHFFDDGYSPSVLPLSAALAQATTTIDIGTGIALAPLHDPIRLAEDAATVDLLSGGRFRLGLANGYMDREFDVFDVDKSTRGTRVVETIELCRRAWQEGTFSFDGQLFQYDDLRVEPTPSDGGPEIYLGGTSEHAVERAVRRTDGHIGIVYYDEEQSYRSSFAQFEDNLDRMAGRVDDDFTVALMQYTHVHDDAETAWDQLRPSLAYSRRKYAEHADDRDPSQWELESMTKTEIEQVRNGALVGDTETIVDQLRTYEAAVDGELHVLTRMWHPLLDFETHAEAIERFGEEVIPAFE